jgi:hypothetical protein
VVKSTHWFHSLYPLLRGLCFRIIIIIIIIILQEKFASVCFCRYFPHSSYSYTSALENLRLHSLSLRRHLLDVLFFIQVYRGLKSCSSLLDNASLRVPTCHVRDFSTVSVRPSSRCALAANVVSKDLDIFAGGAVSMNHILQACTKPFTTLLA